MNGCIANLHAIILFFYCLDWDGQGIYSGRPEDTIAAAIRRKGIIYNATQSEG